MGEKKKGNQEGMDRFPISGVKETCVTRKKALGPRAKERGMVQRCVG